MADLVAERSPQGDELAYARSRFLLECRALGIEPIDAPYTYSDAEGCEREARRSRQLGYRSKSTVTAAHVAVIHRVLTPGAEEVETARRLVAAFEAARAEGKDRALSMACGSNPQPISTRRGCWNARAGWERRTTRGQDSPGRGRRRRIPGCRSLADSY